VSPEDEDKEEEESENEAVKKTSLEKTTKTPEAGSINLDTQEEV
jgi:hypothetical protein